MARFVWVSRSSGAGASPRFVRASSSAPSGWSSSTLRDVSTAGGLARSGLSLATLTKLLGRAPAMTGLGLLDLLKAGTTAANPTLGTAQKAIGTAGSALSAATHFGVPIPFTSVGGIPVLGPALSLASILAGDGNKGEQIGMLAKDVIPSTMISLAASQAAAQAAAGSAATFGATAASSLLPSMAGPQIAAVIPAIISLIFGLTAGKQSIGEIRAGLARKAAMDQEMGFSGRSTALADQLFGGVTSLEDMAALLNRRLPSWQPGVGDKLEGGFGSLADYQSPTSPTRADRPQLNKFYTGVTADSLRDPNFLATVTADTGTGSTAANQALQDRLHQGLYDLVGAESPGLMTGPTFAPWDRRGEDRRAAQGFDAWRARATELPDVDVGNPGQYTLPNPLASPDLFEEMQALGFKGPQVDQRLADLSESAALAAMPSIYAELPEGGYGWRKRTSRGEVGLNGAGADVAAGGYATD